ncbi:hypothetical protein [Nannocystis pusilla]|uniref:hypothetical protein n=1 Tax=Nannocystis pusilla TaxID=889268 RepID=UPI003B7771D3
MARGLARAGPAAAPALTGLIAEKSFTEELRGLLIADLVAVTPADKLPELVALVGLGAPALRAALRQAIVRRAHSSAGERAQLIKVVDAALDAREPTRLPGLVLLRAALGDAGDAAFTGRAAALAEDAAGEFAARVAAIRVLVARRSDPAAQDVLARLVEQHLPADKRVALRSEILGSLALAGVDATRAAALVERLQLIGADAPRVATAAFAVAALPDSGAWLDASQRHAWPEVRAAALARVDGPAPPRSSAACATARPPTATPSRPTPRSRARSWSRSAAAADPTRSRPCKQWSSTWRRTSTAGPRPRASSSTATAPPAPTSSPRCCAAPTTSRSRSASCARCSGSRARAPTTCARPCAPPASARSWPKAPSGPSAASSPTSTNPARATDDEHRPRQAQAPQGRAPPPSARRRGAARPARSDRSQRTGRLPAGGLGRARRARRPAHGPADPPIPGDARDPRHRTRRPRDAGARPRGRRLPRRRRLPRPLGGHPPRVPGQPGPPPALGRPALPRRSGRAGRAAGRRHT